MVWEEEHVDPLPLRLLTDCSLPLLFHLLHLRIRQRIYLILVWCRPHGTYDVADQVCLEIFLLLECIVASRASEGRIVRAKEMLP